MTSQIRVLSSHSVHFTILGGILMVKDEWVNRQGQFGYDWKPCPENLKAWLGY